MLQNPDSPGWACFTFKNDCKQLQLGQLFFSRVVADALEWAHCILSCLSRWLPFGRLIFRQMLQNPDAPGWACCTCNSYCQQLQLGQLYFSRGDADALEWAHCISSCRCRWLRFGPLLFWQMLLMP